MSDVERRVREFYDREGWVADARGRTGEDAYFRQLGEGRSAYDREKIRKTAALFDGREGTLLIAGGGDLPASHMLVAEKFERVVCVDISWRALEISRAKLGARGEYHQASMLALPLADGSVDAVLCAHVLYHVDRDDQQRAVGELIRVTRPGGRIVVVYGNPRAPLALVQRALRGLRVNRLLGREKLYVHAHPLSWWSRFARECHVQVRPCDVMSTNQARALLPTEGARRRFFGWATAFEDRRPWTAARLWTYPAIVLDRRAAGTRSAGS
jgi:SAM-dependent methyltransferase